MFCLNLYNSKYTLLRHINNKHSKNKNNNIVTNNILTNNIVNNNIVTNNIVNNNEYLELTCKYCKKIFSRKDSLNRHIIKYCKKINDYSKNNELVNCDEIKISNNKSIKNNITTNNIITNNITTNDIIITNNIKSIYSIKSQDDLCIKSQDDLCIKSQDDLCIKSQDDLCINLINKIINNKITNENINKLISNKTINITQNIQNIQNVQNIQNIQNVQNVQNIQNIQNVKNVQNIKNINNIINQTVNNTINQTNNIIINNFGDESIKKLNENDILQCIDRCYSCIPELFKLIHIDIPENRNLYLSNMKDSYLYMYKNNEWVINDLDKILKYIKDDKKDLMEEYYFKNIDKFCSNKQKNINNMINDYNNGKLDKQYNKKIKMILVSNKDLLRKK